MSDPYPTFLDEVARAFPLDSVEALTVDEKACIAWLGRVRLHQLHAWRAGRRIPAEVYLRHFAALPLRPELGVDVICGEILVRQQLGEALGVEEYVRRFPEHTEELRCQWLLLASSSLTAGSTSARDVMDSTVALPAPNGQAGPAGPPGYRLLGEVSRGGMGVVFKAEQVKLGRVVALKMVLAGEYAGREQLARFLAEAEVAASLQHPGIAQVHDFGEHQGRPFYSMEFVAGGSLAEKLREGSLPPRQAAELLEKLARAVQYAHDQGVVHRDLKPGNVLLTETGEPKVGDFGIAKRLDPGAGPTLTGTAAVLGTPAYMAPEQARGETRQAGPAADVWALGAILYETLTGRPPFKAASPFETLQLVQTRDPVAVRSLQPSVPRDLETIALECLHKDPRRRYASAAALADDLARFREGKPIRARPLSPPARLWRWCRRNPSVAAAAVFSLLLLLGTVGLTAWYVSGVWQAERWAEVQEFSAGLERVRQRRAEPYPGWTEESLKELRGLAGMRPAREHGPELRSEAAMALAGIELVPDQVVGKGFSAYYPAYSLDGRILALGGWGHDKLDRCAVRLFDSEDGHLIRELAFSKDSLWSKRWERSDGCRCLCFSPDGRWLVAGTRSGRLHRWDLSDPGAEPTSWNLGKNLGETPACNEIRALAFDADGGTLYSSNNCELLAWNVSGIWEQVARFPRAELPVGTPVLGSQSLALSNAGRRKPLLIGLDTRTPAISKSGRHVVCGRICVSPDGRLAAGVGSRLPTGLDLLDADSRETLQSLNTPYGDRAETEDIDVLGFGPGGAFLATASEFGRHVKLWDVLKGQLLHDRALAGGSLRLAFHPAGDRLAVTEDGKTFQYRITRRGVWGASAVQPYRVRALAVAGDTGALITHASDRPRHRVELTVWESRESPPLVPTSRQRVAEASGENKLAVAVDRTGRRFAYTSGQNVWIWEPSGGSPIDAGPVQALKALSFSPDGRLWAADGHSVRVWHDPRLPGKSCYTNDQADRTDGLVFYTIAAGEKWVIAGRRDGRLFLLDDQGEHQANWPVAEAPLSGLALSPDEDLALAGCESGSLSLIRIPSGEVVLQLPEAHRDKVMHVAFMPGGLLVSGSRDRTVKFWTRQGDRVLTLRMPGPVADLAFSDGGRTLTVLVDGERGVRRWHLGRLRAALVGLGIDPGFTLP